MNMTYDYTIHSEKRAGHWVSWITAAGNPDAGAAGSVLLVGQTQEEAEMNSHRWAERVEADSRLLRG